jgi:hypothetical protein
MPRAYDHGKSAYGSAHRTPGREQVVRHIIANHTLEQHGVRKDSYQAVAADNYRMGARSTNDRDRLVDNGIDGIGAAHGAGYNPSYIASHGVAYQRQVDLLGAKFDTAKAAYQLTGDAGFKQIASGIRDIAHGPLDVDRRQFRM